MLLTRLPASRTVRSLFLRLLCQVMERRVKRKQQGLFTHATPPPPAAPVSVILISKTIS